MKAVLERLITGNPLLAHGPRTHGTGIVLPSDARARRDLDPADAQEHRAA